MPKHLLKQNVCDLFMISKDLQDGKRTNHFMKPTAWIKVSQGKYADVIFMKDIYCHWLDFGMITLKVYLDK